MRIRKGRKAKVLSWIMTVMFVLCAGTAWALPGGGTVVSGSDAPVVDGKTMTINQTAGKSIINWDSYSIAKGETVQYTQMPDDISLNRVTGVDPSAIYGQITAGGAVWVINPNGLLIGSSAKINVGSFLGSTLNITDGEFNGSSPYSFTDGANGITNQGKITTTEDGYVALLAPSITNKGTITTPSGQTLIASGNAVTLDINGAGMDAINIDAETAGDALGIVNSGKIIADGGLIYLAADSAGDPLKTVINNTGVIQARTISNIPVGGVSGGVPYTRGTIYLLGNANNGLGNRNTINVGGTLDASAPNGGDGGWIETSAARVMVANNANVTTNAPKGETGWWSIDPDGDFNIGASSGAGEGGSITGSKLGSTLGKTNVEIQTFHPGSINVNQPVSWSSNNTLQLRTDEYINVNKNITASGKEAGLVLNSDDGDFPEGPVADPLYFLQLNNGSVITLSGADAQLKINKDEYTVINSANVRFLDFQFNAPDLAGNYALGTNINASLTAGWDGGAGFTPVGTEDDPFTGNFTGLGHTISNLTINRPDTLGVGLFGCTEGSIISYVGLTGGSVTGREDVGALAGKIRSGSYIFNSYATTKVTGNNEVGGLVGENEGLILNSYATGKVNGVTFANVAGNGVTTDNGIVRSEDVGGLVGDNDGWIINSYAKGAVSGTDSVGGLVGFNDGWITNSNATGAVTGVNVYFDDGFTVIYPNEAIGGLVGDNEGWIMNSNATGEVSGFYAVGGLVGDNDGTIMGSVVDNTYEGYTSFATGKVNGYADVGGLVGYNDGSIWWSKATGAVNGSMTAGGLVGFNYGNILGSLATGAVTGNSNVMGAALFGDTLFTVNGGAVLGGLVGVNDGSIKYSRADGAVSGGSIIGGLAGVNDGLIYVAHANGNVTGSSTPSKITIETINEGLGYEPAPTDFTASIDGGNIVGGLVGINSGRIKSADANGNVTGGSIVGGLVGLNIDLPCDDGPGGQIMMSEATGNVKGGSNAGSIAFDYNGPPMVVTTGVGDVAQPPVNATITGSIKGGNIVGGLVGLNAGGNIMMTSAEGNVEGGSIVGGLVGLNAGGQVRCALASGNVTGKNNVGNITLDYIETPIIPAEADFDPVVTTANVSIKGGNMVGGLVGLNFDSKIENTLAEGNVTGGNFVGGLVGLNAGAGCMGDGAVITDSAAEGNVIGSKSTGAVTISYNMADSDEVYEDFNLSLTGGNFVGGLVGLNYDGGIINTHAEGNVTGGGNYVGGLVGYNLSTADEEDVGVSDDGPPPPEGALIERSYATGNVKGVNYVGGLVGYNSGVIVDTDAWGNVTGKEAVGGLVGFNDNDSVIVNSYSIGTVSGSKSVGGFVGHNNNGVIISSYWDMTTSGKIIGVGSSNGVNPMDVTGLNTPAMMQESSFEGWDFDNVWSIDEGVTYPLVGVLAP